MTISEAYLWIKQQISRWIFIGMKNIGLEEYTRDRFTNFTSVRWEGSSERGCFTSDYRRKDQACAPCPSLSGRRIFIIPVMWPIGHLLIAFAAHLKLMACLDFEAFLRSNNKRSREVSAKIHISHKYNQHFKSDIIFCRITIQFNRLEWGLSSRFHSVKSLHEGSRRLSP